MKMEVSLGLEVVVDKKKNLPLCHVIRGSFNPSKTEFLTPGHYAQQVGIIKYAKGGTIRPHYHNNLKREIYGTQEVLVIRKGSVKVTLFDVDQEYVTDIVLVTGDVIMLASGGHGFEMIDDCEMLEIKQGPYNGLEEDKTHF